MMEHAIAIQRRTEFRGMSGCIERRSALVTWKRVDTDKQRGTLEWSLVRSAQSSLPIIDESVA